MRKLKKEIWPYMVAVDKVESGVGLYEIEIWLNKTFGQVTDRWNIIYKFYNRIDVYFKNGEDATFFSLRWT